MTEKLLATRIFTLADQQMFASISGDTNPMHLDPVFSRRTQAGEPAVHGMHALLWSLEQFCAAEPDADIEGVTIKFEKFIPLDTPLSLFLVEGRSRKIVLRHLETRLMQVMLKAPAAEADSEVSWDAPADLPASPIELTVAEAQGLAGGFRLTRASAAFPTLAAKLGDGTIDALAGMSSLVGMLAPGLHSIFSAGELRFGATPAPAGVLGYKVLSVHDIYHLIETEVVGPGVSGKVKAFFRPPPTRQDSMADLKPLVGEGEFKDVRALIIGGSRGIGEVTAKLLAAGGADVAISYAVGKADAKTVVDDIGSAGGRCRAIHVDVNGPLGPQLPDAASFVPTHLFYYATTKIFLQGDGLFDQDAFQRFNRVYVTAFAELCGYAGGLGAPVTLFYPSSSALDERPKGMTEYAMAKAAGEVFCADAPRMNPNLKIAVTRLPRLSTDQTATVSVVKTTPMAPYILSILRSLDPA